MIVCRMGRSGKKASPQGSKPAKEQREVKTENGVHLANAYSGIKEKGWSLKTIMVEDSQEDEQLLRVVSQIEEKSFANNKKQHVDDMFEMNPVISEWLNCLLEVFEQVNGVALNEREMS